MALKIAIETVHGATAEYWKIGTVGIDYLNKIVQIHLHGYANPGARRADKPSLETKVVTLPPGEFDYPNGEPTRALLYAKVRTHEMFVGSTDVFEKPAPASAPADEAAAGDAVAMTDPALPDPQPKPTTLKPKKAKRG